MNKKLVVVVFFIFLVGFVLAQITGDSLIEVSGRKQIGFGDKLGVRVTLIPNNGDSEVLVNYLVKDTSGNIFVQESETIMIGKEESLRKRLSTENLPVGNYIVGMELVYPRGIAVSSSSFEIVSRSPRFNLFGGLGLVLLGLIVGIVIVVILIIFYITAGRKRLKR